MPAAVPGSGPSAICTAAGEDYAAGGQPLLVVSTNGGVSWAVPTIAGLPAVGTFSAASCTGSGPSAICTAAGEDYAAGGQPLLVVSTNGGASWAVPTIAGLPAEGTFNAASCTGSGPSAICTAAGQDSTDAPILVVSTNGGASWAVPTIAGLPAEGTFSAASCTGSGPSAICTAAGRDFTGTGPPLLAVSTNGANTWQIASVTNLPATGNFLGAAATGGK
jgi:hypothetical protein